MAEPLWTRAGIENALGLASSTSGTAPITGVSIDSRTVQPGDLFVAIKGENNDGHAFVEQAIAKGASAALVSREFASHAQANAPKLIAVNDTLEALNQLGRAARARADARIVAVTGSVGKTCTKEMLRTILGASSSVHASEKSYNNLWGVPLSLARMPCDARFGIFEIGMNHAGEITPLTKLVRSHAAIVTWIDAVHMEFFNSVEDIADAKAEIFNGVDPDGFVVLPADNPHFARLRTRAIRKGLEVVPFGEEEIAQGRLIKAEAHENGMRVSASIMGDAINFHLGAFGKHLAANAVAALTAAKLLGAGIDAGADALASFHAPEGRGRRRTFETPDGPILLIDETYNANPASMRAALSVLGSVSRENYPRRVAILGDMLELGHGSPDFHASLVSAIDSNAIDLVLCAGAFMQRLYERLPRERQGAYASTSEALKPALLNEIRGGDAVMIKGSLGSKMGLLAEALTAQLNLNAITGKGRDAA